MWSENLKFKFWGTCTTDNCLAEYSLSCNLTYTLYKKVVFVFYMQNVVYQVNIAKTQESIILNISIQNNSKKLETHV